MKFVFQLSALWAAVSHALAPAHLLRWKDDIAQQRCKAFPMSVLSPHCDTLTTCEFSFRCAQLWRQNPAVAYVLGEAHSLPCIGHVLVFAAVVWS